MVKFSGALCEVCDKPVILFLLTERGIVIDVGCQKCGKQHNISISDLIDDIAHFCCEYELLPAEFDELSYDFEIEVVCPNCKGCNDVSADEMVTLLQEPYQEQEYEMH